MKLITVACLLWALAACVAPGTEEEQAVRPNVVILYTDDQGYGDCSALNLEAGFQTPHMDRLAREGMVFTDGHSAGSVCTPSRFALLTGTYAWRLPSGGGVVGADTDGLIADDQWTVASLLKGRGYATGIVGKWHLGMQIPGVKGERDWSARITDGPLQKGFDTYYGIPASMNFGVLTWFDGDRAIEPASLWTRKKFPEAEITTKPLDYRMAPPYDVERQAGGDIEVAPGFRDEDVLRTIAERSVAFIEEHADEPFFLYVALTSPHLPHCTAPEFRGTSGMGNYGDFLVETDHRVGQVLEALDCAGVAGHTMVLLTSDNGPENNYRDWERIYGHRSAGVFRGGKRDVYEGGHRVPFIVRWPGVVEPGSECDQTVSQTGLLGTLADWFAIGLPPDPMLDSRSFLDCLRGATAPPFPLIHQGRGRFAIRDGRWKLHLTPNGREVGDPVELYDLSIDPGETRNLLEAHPEVVDELAGWADSIVRGAVSH